VLTVYLASIPFYPLGCKAKLCLPFEKFMISEWYKLNKWDKGKGAVVILQYLINYVILDGIICGDKSTSNTLAFRQLEDSVRRCPSCRATALGGKKLEMQEKYKRVCNSLACSFAFLALKEKDKRVCMCITWEYQP